MDSRSEELLHIVRIDPGEKIMESLLRYIGERPDEIPSGFLTGIGATSSCEIGWYDLSDEEYKTRVIDENCEITTLIGNITWVEGKPLVHAHITLGKQDYSIIGGHLVEGTISVTGEIWIHQSDLVFTRTPSRFKGLKLIDFTSE